jgi:hypothetical protein
MVLLLLNDGADVINALNNLVNSLVALFGAKVTIGIVVVIVGLTTWWKIWNIKRKDKDVDLALKEKDRTIQRLAEQERNYRILFFKEKCGWTDEQIQQFVMKNEFEDVPSARKELEGEKVSAPSADATRRSRRSRRR